MDTYINRRNFLKKNALVGLGLSIAPGLVFQQSPQKLPKARIGLIGVGLRGTNHLQNLLYRNDVVVPAICDINEERVDIARNMIGKAGGARPEVYSDGAFAYLKMLERKDLDGGHHFYSMGASYVYGSGYHESRKIWRGRGFCRQYH